MRKKVFMLWIMLLAGVLLILTAAGCAPTNQDEMENESVSMTETPQPTPTVLITDLAPSAIPGEVVYIPFPVQINVDGKLEDWQNIPVTEVIDEDAVDPAENGSFTFSVAADMENFYITMQMPDKNIVAGQHGTNFWNEDSFEFYINASGDLAASSYQDKIFQININAADIGNTDPDILTITGVFCTGYDVNGYVFKTDDGWGIEASIPLKGLVEPVHGEEIGFQAQINGATLKDRDVKISWSNADTEDESWEKPYLFGRGIFFEVGRTDIPEPSAQTVIATAMPTPTPVVVPPLLSVNQTGYFVNGEKTASLASDATQPLAWSLVDQSGVVLLEGQSVVKGSDAASGDHLHIIDFSVFNTPGNNYRIVTDDLESVPFDISNDIYSQLKNDALAYFYLNRSGIAIDSAYAGEQWARPAGHLTDNVISCYKGVDADGVSWPGCDYTLDVSGGWYDAGDFGKYVVNGGISVWTLMDLYERFPQAFPDGSLSIPENSNDIPDILDEARWEMDFLLKMQVPEGQELAGMVHHKMHDLNWSPIPMIPPTEVENDVENNYVGTGRHLFAPSTAATLNLAATGAQCARIWKNIDAEYADSCLSAAETAWQAALANPAIYAGNNPGNGGGNYSDVDVTDEFYWAAAELFITTGDAEYQEYLLNSPVFAEDSQFDWGRTAPLGNLSLIVTDAALPETQNALLRSKLLAFADDMLAVQAADGYGVLIEGTYPWGSNGQILNTMMLMSVAHDLTGEQKYLDSVRLSMDYLMGRNALNRSYVSGYGEYPMLHPHHRFWANDPGNGYPPPPAGAVSGGPNNDPTEAETLAEGVMDEAPAKRYTDILVSASTNEVAINWNAPLAWVATYLDAQREK